MAQFVLLSVLLHAFFILLFGAPAGGSREGSAMWGSLAVTIRGPLMEPGIGLQADRGADARLLRPPPTERPTRARETPPPAAAPPPPVRLVPDLDATKLQENPAPLPEPIAAPPVTPVLPVLRSAPALTLSPITPATADLMPAPRVDPLARPVPVVTAPLLEFTPRPATEPALAPSVRVQPTPIPTAAVPAPLSERTAPAAAPPLLAPPTLAPVVAPPAELPVIAAPLLEHSAVPVVAPGLAPAADLAPIAPPARQDAAPVSPDAAPSTSERAPAPAAERLSPRVPETAAGGSPPRDSPIFDNRKPPATSVPIPGTGPRIDLDAARATARAVAREGMGNRSLLPFPMPPPPERKTKEQIAIENARKPDCRDAYKGLGLLAVIPLLANEIGEGSCRW